MKIYSKGISEERIDYIVERRLKAYVDLFGKYAIVTVADDERTAAELGEYLEIEKTDCNYFEFLFSPTKIVASLQYILVPDEERQGYDLLIKDFKQSFYDYIIKYFEDGNIPTKAEVIRIIWGTFSGRGNIPYKDVDEKEKAELLKVVNVREDEIWAENEFLKLIIKYAIHLTSWERKYGYNAAIRHLESRLSAREPEQFRFPIIDVKTVTKRYQSWFAENIELKYKKEKQDVSVEFKKDKIYERTMQMVSEMYKEMRLQLNRGADRFQNFFLTTQKADMKRKSKDLELMTLLELLLFVNFLDYATINKSQKVEFLIDESNHVGDISAEVDNILSAAIEVVLMLNLFINDCNDEEIQTHPFARLATNLHVYVIPAIEAILAEGDDLFKEEAVLERIQHDTFLQNKITNIARRKMEELKKRDAGTIIGSYYMYATSKADVLQGTKYKDVRTRARDKEKQYWDLRKKCLIRSKYEGVSKIELQSLHIILHYMAIQNKSLRDKVREALLPYIEQ